jgi:hypothetical protein
MSLNKRLFDSSIGCTTNTLDIFGDGSCKAAYNFEGNTNDLSGNFNATATNLSYTTGKFGQAANCSSSSIDTGINTTNFISDLNNRTVDFSFSGWAIIDSYPQGDNTIFYVGNYNVYSPLYAAIILDFRSASKKIRFTHQTQNIESTSTFNSPTGWTHVVGVRESSVLKLYINTTLESSVTLTANTGVSSSTTLDLGGFKYSTAAGLDGKLDQVRFFNKALSQTEITTLYNEIAC